MNAGENIRTKLNTTTRYSQNLIGLGFLLALTAGATLASSEEIDVPIVAFSNPTLGMQLTKVITTTGSHVVVQEFPMRTDKDGKVHTCVRPDPEGDLDVICLINPQRK
jgi:hypothetical protein